MSLDRVRPAFCARRGVSLALLTGLVVCPAPAEALGCTVAPQSVPFGSYDTLASSPVDGVGTVRITCDSDTAFSVSLGPGAGTYEARVMQNGADNLLYNLYTDAARLIIWGDGISGGSTVSGSGTSVDLTVYGRIPARQNVNAGAYSDIITVTVTF